SLGGSPLLDLANGGFLEIDGDPLIPYPFLIFAVVIALGAYVLHYTVFGRYLYAIGGNRDAAAYSGINVKRVETSSYVISAGLGGVAGVCYASYIGQMSQQVGRSEEHTSELQSRENLVCRLLLEKKKKTRASTHRPKRE